MQCDECLRLHAEVQKLRSLLSRSEQEEASLTRERDKAILQNKELRSSLAEMVQGLNGLDSDRRWTEEIEDAEGLLRKTDPENQKCEHCGGTGICNCVTLDNAVHPCCDCS